MDQFGSFLQLASALKELVSEWVLLPWLSLTNFQKLHPRGIIVIEKSSNPR